MVDHPIRHRQDTRADGDAVRDRIQAAVSGLLAMLGIDRLGLDGQDRKYLETILRVFSGGPVGVEAIAHTMNLAVDTLIDEVEPFLLRSELLVRTPRGRKMTPMAFDHLGLTMSSTPPEGEQGKLFN